MENILKWHCNFDKPNIAIITGEISKLIVLDIDKPSLLPELFKRLPETERTTRVKTPRGYHLYFSDNGNEKIITTNNFLELGIELKYNGCYVVASPSIIEGFKYDFEIPLSKILPFPKIVLEGSEKKEGVYPKKVVEYKQARKYRGQGVACIGQIIDKDLQVGERDSNLYILYNLLLQNKNALNYSQKIVRDKNLSLTKPLPDKEIENIFKKAYNYRCSSIIEKLPYVNCESCEFKFKGGKFKMSNPIIKNLRRLGELSSGEQKVLLFLGSYFQGEEPSQSEIIKVSKLSKPTVSKAMGGLKEKGFI